MILYLHGFRSSPQSQKAQAIFSLMRQRGLSLSFECPTLPASPAKAIQIAIESGQKLATRNKQSLSSITLIGSSLGGYYARYLAERWNCKAVVINPTVYACRDLSTQLMHTCSFDGQTPFYFKPEYLKELNDLFCSSIKNPKNYWLFAAQKDELLDWKEMYQAYTGARLTLSSEENHSFLSFSNYLTEVLAFSQQESTEC